MNGSASLLPASAIFEELGPLLSNNNHTLVVFLDYDGTLSPIVENPDAAFLPEATRVALKELSTKYPTAIISGRSKEKIKQFVDLDGIVYAGSHGFRVEASHHFEHELCVGSEHRELLLKCAEQVRSAIASVAGASVEWNDLAFSVHYRCVAEDQRVPMVEQVQLIVDEYSGKDHGAEEEAGTGVGKKVGKFNGLETREGNMVLEVQPSIEWNKGKCLTWILERMDVGSNVAVPLYIGDDVTDEDAFKAIQEYAGVGFSILVAEDGGKKLTRSTNAGHFLDSPQDVEAFLRQLNQHPTPTASHESN
jgi:trehalose-phosphatase